MIKQPTDIIYPFSCESPTKPQTKGQVGQLLMSPKSYNLKSCKSSKGLGYIYTITVRTPEKANPKKRKILEITRPILQQMQSMDEIKAYIKQNDTKLPDEVKRGYIGLTGKSPKKRLRTHGRNAKKGSHLKVHKAMRKGARNGKDVRASVVASVPLEKLGAFEEAYRQLVAGNKENICLNMRRGGAGGGGHKF